VHAVSLTSRGKITIGAVAGTLVLAGVGALAFTGNAPAPLQRLVDQLVNRPPDPCPLTGVAPRKGKEVPDRPLLAVKIENSPDARPQAGLEHADVVYEEPVEGGLTRFIALYHCADAKRLGPVRSARVTDPDVLAQFGRPLFGYAGAANAVKAVLAKADLIDLSYLVVDAYVRDPNRSAPHNLYSSTRSLWRAGGRKGEPPAGVFTFSEELEVKGKKARSAHIPFSYASDVYWSWDAETEGWLRSHGTTPHLTESGAQVRADTVVVMHVPVTLGEIRDAAGARSPEVTLTGKGQVWILRDGRVIAGRWERPTLGQATRFVARNGDEIALRPGTTWIELVPDDVEPDFSAGRA
jgi:hypothetical protein